MLSLLASLVNLVCYPGVCLDLLNSLVPTSSSRYGHLPTVLSPTNSTFPPLPTALEYPHPEPKTYLIGTHTPFALHHAIKLKSCCWSFLLRYKSGEAFPELWALRLAGRYSHGRVRAG